MKKLTLLLSTLLILALTACSAQNATESTSGQPNGLSNELPIASKLVIGSFKLEDTDLAITAEQATDLLPLWQVYEDLSSSDAAAQEEVDALIEQIQETMTPEQMTSINAMNLTPQDVFSVMQEQGVQFASRPQQSDQGNGGQNNGGEPPEVGGPVIIQGPGGGPGGAGGPGGGGQGLSPQQIATAQARRDENGGGGFALNGTPTPLIEALVRLLKEKASA